MMKKQNVGGRSSSARIAKEINGMVLAQAFVASRAAGFKLLVNKLDGVSRFGELPEAVDARIIVNVANGTVTKSWVG